MVRLERIHKRGVFAYDLTFTFQYGQIRKKYLGSVILLISSIYIPVWLDQKVYILNMQYCLYMIYIPVWLDQKDNCIVPVVFSELYLHSSMVRLERPNSNKKAEGSTVFTFQYGQIRKLVVLLYLKSIKAIYIPVWLDQKGAW